MLQRIRRMLLLTLAAMVLTAAMTAGASAVRIKTTETVNLRKGPSQSKRILTVVPKNTKRRVLRVSKNKKWYKIKVNGKSGYVLKKYTKKAKTSAKSRKKLLGEFRITFYGDDTMTASGKVPRINHTVAVDPRVISLGSKIYIEGMGTYYAEDTGGVVKGNIIDVFVRTEREANALGVRHRKVYLYR